MNVPYTPGREGMPDEGRTPADVMIEEIEEFLQMAGKHGKPSTGDGRTSGRKPAKTQVAITSPGGATMHKKTATLFSKLLPKWDGKTK